MNNISPSTTDKSVNEVHLIGQLAQDPLKKLTNTGKAVATSSLYVAATARTTTYVRIVAFEDCAELLLGSGVIPARRHLLGHAEPGDQRLGVVGTQFSLPPRENSAELLLGPGMIPARRHLPGNAEPGRQRVRVIGTQYVPLVNQSPLILLDRLV